jgi:hypothetical protein
MVAPPQFVCAELNLMGFRFREHLRIAKGLYLNFGKRGLTSVSKRTGRATVTVGKRGAHESVRLGHGLSYGCLVPILAIPTTLAACWLLAH